MSPPLYWACDYLFIPGSKLIHISKMCPVSASRKMRRNIQYANIIHTLFLDCHPVFVSEMHVFRQFVLGESCLSFHYTLGGLNIVDCPLHGFQATLHLLSIGFLGLTVLSKNRKSCFKECLNRAPFYWHGLTLIPAWICNYILSKVWDEITYPFLNFNGALLKFRNG